MTDGNLAHIYITVGNRRWCKGCNTYQVFRSGVWRDSKEMTTEQWPGNETTQPLCPGSYPQNISVRRTDQVASDYADGFKAGLAEAARLCERAAQAYDDGAGSSHSPEARKIGKAQALWCRDEILRLENSK